MPAEGGPYVAMAVLCERVLEERDGTLSIIRVVDRITQTVMAASDAALPPVIVSLSAVVSLKSGSARGSHKLAVRPETPLGVRLSETSTSVLLEGEDRGAGFTLTLANLVLDQEGLYWFDVLLDDAVITRMPLRIVRQRVSVGPPPTP